MGKLKALCLIDTLEMGGTEKSMLELLSRAAETEAVLCHLYPGDRLKQDFLNAEIAVVSLGLQGKFDFLRAVRQVENIAKAIHSDLIHTSLFRADVAGRMAGHKMGVPVISSFVGETYAPVRTATMSRTRRTKLRVVQEIDRLTARWCAHFTAVSHSVKTSMVESLGVTPERISVIYRGREPAKYAKPVDCVIGEIRQALGIRNDEVVLLHVGRLVESKGQADLVRAIPAILQANHRVRLLIAGEGPFRPQLETLIRDLDIGASVRLLGERQDVPLLLHCADLFVFPSYHEGNPGALVEAMLAGLPVVASDIPAHREIVQAGETGLLAPPQEARILAETTQWALTHQNAMAEMGERAQRLAVKRFDIACIAQQFETLCQDTVAQWRAAH